MYQPAKVLEGRIVDQAFPVGLIDETRIRIGPDLDEADDLVVAEADDRIVYPSLIEPQPVVMRFAVWPDPESVTVDAHPGPFLEPRTYVHAGADAGKRFRLEVKRVDLDLDGTTSERGIGPFLNRPATAIDAGRDAARAIKARFDALGRLTQKI